MGVSGERVLVVRAGKPVRARATGMAKEGFAERGDLQQWLLEDPTLLGEGLLVLTEELARWIAPGGGAVRNRLDLLALGRDGRLAVIELKRAASRTHHLQAITYASMVARCSEEDLAGYYAEHQAKKHGEEVSRDQALERLRAHCDGELDPQQLKRPRIVLVAADFPAPVRSAAVWLNDTGIDVELLKFTLWRAEQPLDADEVTLTVATVYPPPGMEQFTIEPERARRAHSERKTRRDPRVVTIRAHGLVTAGDPLTYVPPGTEARQWVDQDPERGRACWVDDPVNVLQWEVDSAFYSLSGLAKHIEEQATGSEQPARNGTLHWANAQGTTLFALVNAYESS